MRQLIVFAGLRLLSVSTDNGELFWSYPWRTGRFDVHAATPIFIAPDKIFISSAYGKGAAVVQVKVMDSPESGSGIKMEVEEIWRSERVQNRLSTSVLHDNHLYGFHKTILKCIDANTGSEKWKARGFGEGTLILAEDHLIILGDRGKLGLVEATPAAFNEVASAEVLSGLCWTVPTLANGRLYARNEKEIVCLDMTGQN